MLNLRKTIAALAAGVFAVGCNDLTDLDIENPNSPDAIRALASPEDVEASIGSSFYNWYEGWQWDCYPSWGLSSAASEIAMSWGNCTAQDAGTIPRPSFTNTTAYSYRWLAQSPWYDLYGVVSQVNDALAALDNGMQIGPDGARNARARAFAKFTQGLAYGYIALMFDQAFLVDEKTSLEGLQFEMADYKTIMAAAIKFLDEAATIAAANSFTLEPSWINGTTMSNQQLARLAKSYSARMLAAVARTPAERAAVPWNEVLSRIDAGITSDFVIEMDGDKWRDFTKQRAQNQTWQRAHYITIGEADKSGAFEAWLATPAADRTPFDIVTDDRRITAGDPKSDGTDFRYLSSIAFQPARGTYFFSRYYHKRYAYLLPTNHVGPSPQLTMTEMDLLRAEAYLRTNQKALAVPLINKTRVGRGQLPAASASEPIDGRGGLMEKMQYEKRIELFAMVSGNHFFDARGWGRLVTGTPMHYPVPALELEGLAFKVYTFGGPAGGTATCTHWTCVTP